LIPSTGGQEIIVAQADFHSLGWWNDNRLIATVNGTPAKIVAVDSSIGSMSEVMLQPAGIRGDYSPAVSPDGRFMSFVRSLSREASELRIISLGKSLPLQDNSRVLVSRANRIEDPQWTPDGKTIVFARGTLGNLHLARIRVDGSVTTAIPEAGSDVNFPAIARSAWKLAYSRDIVDANVVEYQLKTPSGPVTSIKRAIASTSLDEEGRYSPDGQSIAFLSRRSGSLQAWLSDRKTGRARVLTQLPDIDDATLYWHPDGTRVGLGLNLSSSGPGAYFVRLGDRSLEKAFAGSSTDMACSVSRDGKWVYFSSTRSGSYQLWKHSLENGREVQVTTTGGAFGVESHDGKTLFYCPRHESEGVWQMALPDGVPRRLTGPMPRRNMMAVGRDGLYYMASQKPPRLMMYRFSDRKHIELAQVDKYPGWGLHLSPDGTSLLLGLYDVRDSDVMIVSNFR
jgi:Tol biopolymer transport system component